MHWLQTEECIEMTLLILLLNNFFTRGTLDPSGFKKYYLEKRNAFSDG